MTDSAPPSPFEPPSFPAAPPEEEDGPDSAVDPGDLVSTGDTANVVSGGTARAVLEHVARSIVDEPDAVVVDVQQDRSGVRLSLHVSPGDMGRIIGRRGRVAQAIRSLVRAAAARDGTEATVDIVD